MHHPQKLRGFSLVELSIVLVIVGLLTGGILMGQSLIRNAEIQSVITDAQKYKDAANQFREQYDALPGDMPDATNYWGSKGGTGSDVTCHQTILAGVATCNGNGDGVSNQITGDTAFGERYLYWQHLAASKIISGIYTGASSTAGAGTETRVAGVNVPAGKINNSLFAIVPVTGSITGSTHFFDGTYPGNVLDFFGTPLPLKPEEAWNIDSKIDDGRPATGTTFQRKASSTTTPNCTTTDVVTTAEYNLSNTNKLCDLWFYAN